GDDAAARGSYDAHLVQAVDGQKVEDVEQLDIGNIVAPFAVVLRAAAPAIVETVDVARLLRVARQIGGQRVEVAAVASEPGKADDATEFRRRRLVVAGIEPKIVEGPGGNILPQLGRRLGHVGGRALGSALGARVAR